MRWTCQSIAAGTGLRRDFRQNGAMETLPLSPRSLDLAQSLVSRAEAAGYKAIVVTLDTWVPGWRPRR